MKDNYTLLIEKLDKFIRKFYLNKLIRGSLYSVALILVIFLGMNFLEHYFYFDTSVRKVLFYSFVGVSGVALAYWVITPLLHYFHLGKQISHAKAAGIIGDHFTDVKDKLLNILQLRAQADSSAEKALIFASINQKSDKISPVPFRAAINLSQNRKYLRYALPPLLFLFIVLFAAPSLLKDSTNRLLNNNKEFKKPAPFSFVLNEENLNVVQFEDFPLTVKIEGGQLPNEVFIDIDNYKYRLTKIAADSFAYRFSNVQKELNFQLFSSGVESEDYTLNVLKKPNIAGFETELDYPAYTKRKDEKLSSVGDLVVPAGTNINWIFNALNTSSIKIAFAGEKDILETKRFSDELFSYKKRVIRDQSYKLFVSNEELPLSDSISYTLTVIPDLFPEISVEQFIDSTDKKLFFFVGDASDDYGLNSLSFNYRIKHEGGSEEAINSVLLQKPVANKIRYDYSFDLNEIELTPGDEVTFFFEVFDNDGVNGQKSARTNVMVFAVPTLEELDEMSEENDKKIKDDLSKSIEEAKKIQEDLKKMREKLLQEKELDWKSKKELEKILDRQKELEKQFEQAKDAFEENKKNEEEFSEQDEKIMEKQEKLQELFEEVMSDEMKELMKQIEDLMQEMEKDDALEKMEEMEMNDEEMENELDRLLELYKQLEVEKEMQDAIDELEKLAEEQEKLSEETKNEESPNEELQEKQEEIQKEFEKIEEKIEDTKEKNEELESPMNLGDQDEEMEDIEQDMNDSQEQMEQKDSKGASESQKSAAEKMKKMADGMSMDMQAGEMEQMEEDMKALRQLLENLVNLSFDQESLMDDFSETQINTPRYVGLIQEQFKLKDDFKLVEDSLQALSKRITQIESFVTGKVSDIKNNMRKGIKELEERHIPQATDQQQRSMKNLNDLALMLSEAMNQMQQQMSGMTPGSKMCKKPGGKGKNGNVPKDKMGQGQKSVNDQMKKMMEKMKEGKGKGGSSKEFAQMAAKQAAMRKALQEKQGKLQQQGQGDKELQDLINEMNKVETDLVNKKLTNEMMLRQEDILTRLLKHEKAERQREYDNKRKAETAQQFNREMPPSLKEYIKKREAEIDLYKSVSPALKPYYKQLVDEYFKSLKGE